MIMGRRGFVPISMERYIKIHLKSNPGAKRERVKAALKRALNARKSGVLCQCGEPIWVIGSAMVGNRCFTCITGESEPDHDYEIDEALRY